MISHNLVEVEVPVLGIDRGPTAVEKLPAEPMGPNRYKLLSSPGLVEGLAAGDIFEVDENEPLGYRIIHRGMNLCVWVFFDTIGANRGPATEPLVKGVEAMGGRLDGGGHTSLIFTIPVSVGFAPVEAFFSGMQGRLPGSTWMFGNVYDPRDGQTPLNWWHS